MDHPGKNVHPAGDLLLRQLIEQELSLGGEGMSAVAVPVVERRFGLFEEGANLPLRRLLVVGERALDCRQALLRLRDQICRVVLHLLAGGGVSGGQVSNGRVRAGDGGKHRGLFGAPREQPAARFGPRLAFS